MKYVFLLMFLSFPFGLFGQNVLNINRKDGTLIKYNIDDIKNITFSNVTSIKDFARLTNIVNRFKVMQNYPNPFNPSTTIKYKIPQDGNISINVFSITGEQICTLTNAFQKKGEYSVVWNGKNQNGDYVASGFYIYTILFNKNIISKKMLLLK